MYHKTNLTTLIVVFILIISSQLLITFFWESGKYLTILNIVLLLICVSAYGRYHFRKMTYDESIQLLSQKASLKETIVTEKSISKLPTIIQKWLKLSGVMNQPKTFAVSLNQKGKMRTKPNSKWMPFEAEQFFNIERTSFVWIVRVKVMRLLPMFGRDKLVDGKGEMLIKLAGFIPVVNEHENHKINSGAMLRYLAEICWFPSAVLHDSIMWETINATSAKAIFTIQRETVSGIFKFTEEGEIISFEANRYYGGANDSTLEKWLIKMIAFKEFNGIKIPNKAEVIWKLKKGDFHWLSLEITDLTYNMTAIN